MGLCELSPRRGSGLSMNCYGFATGAMITRLARAALR